MRLWLNSTSGSTIALRISGVGASVSVILGIIGSTPSDVPQRRASLPRAPSGPLQIKPIVGDVDERSHQRRADAAPLEIIMDGHADLADMAAPSLVLEDVGRSDDAPVKHCDDSGPFLGRIFHQFPPLLLPSVRQPQRTPPHFGEIHERSNFLPVARLTGANRQFRQ